MTSRAKAAARSKNGASLRERVHELGILPTPDVDLLTAPSSTINLFGIPPRPDPAQRKAFRIWKYFFNRSATFVHAGITLQRASFQLNTGTITGANDSRFETSSNWSGAYIVPTGGDMVVAILGRWTVPKPKLPPPPENAPGLPAEYACSTWIGLDGQRLYLNSSLPQIGTTQTLNVPNVGPPVVASFAWFQWWDRPAGGYYIQFSNFPVTIGDKVACLIWVTNASTVFAGMLNLNTNQIAAVTATAPIVNGTPLTISGATAEWIMERPTIFGSDAPYWFPDYGRTRFRDCATATGPTPALPTGGKDLSAPRFIRMYDTLTDPMRTFYISMPEKLSDKRLQVHYGDF